MSVANTRPRGNSRALETAEEAAMAMTVARVNTAKRNATAASWRSPELNTVTSAVARAIIPGRNTW